jgi:hypothetical protein
MAQTPNRGALAFPAEVARYLSVDPNDVKRMIRLAKLPAIRIPAATRAVTRIPLRDFHAWLIARSVNETPEFANYEKFMEDFDQVARKRS